MELTIGAESAEVVGSLRAALVEAGDFELREVGESSVGVVAAAGDAPALAAALSGWLQDQPPGSEMTLETGTQLFTVHAGDPRAAVALNEAMGRESRVAGSERRRPEGETAERGKQEAVGEEKTTVGRRREIAGQPAGEEREAEPRDGVPRHRDPDGGWNGPGDGRSDDEEESPGVGPGTGTDFDTDI